jgi:small ligand-binding sensory domain FIST
VDQCLTSANKQNKQLPPTLCFALLSKSFQSHEYEEVVSYLSERFGDLDKTAIMGCIVDRTATESGHGVSLLIGYGEAIKSFQVVDGPKRQKVRSISVGRWGHVHDFDRLKYQDNTLDTLGWQSFQTVSQPPQQRLDVFRSDCYTASGSSKDQQERYEKPSVIFMASDQEPDQVLQSLDQEYPDTPKLGVVAASTPFVTGSAYTLFHQGQLMKAGMVGFASYSPTPLSTPLFSSVSVRYPYLEPLGPHFTITRARGNIILDLDDQGATRLLINLINEVNSSKDEAFYLAMYSDNGNQQKHKDDGKFMVARITSGDPSRGNMAVDTTLDLKVGQKVQFMRRKTLDTPFESQGLLDPSQGKAETGTAAIVFNLNVFSTKKIMLWHSA